MKKKEAVVLFGTGEMAEVMWEYLTHDSEYEVVGFCVDRDYVRAKTKLKLPVVVFEEVEKRFEPGKYRLGVTISFAGVNRLRRQKYTEAKKKGYSLISYVSSRASVWPSVKIGENSYVLENNVIQPRVVIGNNVIMWSGNHVGHHSVIEDDCFVASQAVISGHVRIRRGCFVGVNATVRDNVVVKAGCVLGAGALITKDTVKSGVYYGPAANVLKAGSDSSKLRKV